MRRAIEAGGSDDPQTILAASAERKRIHAAIAALPQRQRKLIVEYYFDDTSLRVLSGHMHVSPQRASQLHLLAIARLRRQLAPV